MSYHLIPRFETKAETFKYLVDNATKIKQQKTAQQKFTDAVSFSPMYVLEGGDIVSHKTLMAAKEKAAINMQSPIRVKAIINTTNLLDSHGDCHIKGCFNKSIADKKVFDLCKEHVFKFDGTICDDAKASVQEYQWSELGSNLYGTTEALVFDAIIEPSDKTGMYELYAKGKVKNHSIGMRYKNYAVCINSDDENYQLYKSNWDKYRPMVANGDKADEEGYFWAVTELEIIEGSAVKAGSNWITPTQSVENVNDNNDSNKKITQDEPDNSTPNEPNKFDTIDYIKSKQFI